jgi:uncharacterized membrane protein YdbT with pleckstrin-like domain
MGDGYLRSLLSDGEKILLISRQHWFVLLRAIIAEILLAVLILVGVILARLFVVDSPFVFLGYFLLVIPILSLAWDALSWSKRQYVVTSRRVIQISGVYNKNVIDSSLEKVNDVKMTQSFFGRLFGYGDVEIMTASELGLNKFTRIGDPIKFKIVMVNAKEELEKEQAGYHEVADIDVPGQIAKLDELRQRGVITEDEFQRQKTIILTKM